MIQEGFIVNRHIQTLFKEDAIDCLGDLEIKDLAFGLAGHSVHDLLSKENESSSLTNALGRPSPVSNRPKPAAHEREH
jgi:hypothetical protein